MVTGAGQMRDPGRYEDPAFRARAARHVGREHMSRVHSLRAGECRPFHVIFSTLPVNRHAVDTVDECLLTATVFP